eukprot:497543_1
MTRPSISLLLSRLESFVEDDCIPSETEFDEFIGKQQYGDRFSSIPPVMTCLTAKARSLGLWNLFMPKGYPGSMGISMQEYARMSEVMGRSFLAAEACNCSAPDTGNMELLAKYGTREQQNRWLVPLLEGKMKSAFLMTERDVASSDASNISCEIRIERNECVIKGTKWWSTGALDPRCGVFIVMGKMQGPEWEKKPRRARHTLVIVPVPIEGVVIQRALTVFGFDDAPHGHAEVSLLLIM